MPAYSLCADAPTLGGNRDGEQEPEFDADHQSVDQQGPPPAHRPQQGAGAAGLPAEARRLHARLHDDAQEAQLGAAQGRQGTSHQRLRGGELHPGRRPQPAGTFGGHDPRRSRQGPARRALPHHSRHPRHSRRQGPQTAPVEVRRQASEVRRGGTHMSRRRAAEKREVLPDAKFGDIVLSKFMNTLMSRGKKSVAERVVYGALDEIQGKLKQDPVPAFHEALENVKPAVQVRSRRVGGATYQVPVEVRPERRQALAIRWIIQAARDRSGHSMTEKLSAELMDAFNRRGNAVKKREDTHKMADANKAFAHYRW